jgi:hypothetical protein
MWETQHTHVEPNIFIIKLVISNYKIASSIKNKIKTNTKLQVSFLLTSTKLGTWK